MKQLLKSQAIALKQGNIQEATRISLLVSKEDKVLNGDNSFDLICV